MKKTLIISIILIILIICASIFGFVKVREKDRYVERCTETTTAKVLEHSVTTDRKTHGTSNKYFHHITVIYKIDGKEYQKKGVYRGKKELSLDPGTKITIRYNPNNKEEIAPEFTVGYATAKYRIEGYACIVILASFATLAVVGYYKTKNRKQMN